MGATTFTNLNGEVEVRIYSIIGRHVITLRNQGAAEVAWNLLNEQGHPVASGVYFWLAMGANGKSKVGRIAVIR